jgi:predicted dehydrogenase
VVTVTIGFLGCGFIAQYHARQLAMAGTTGAVPARIVSVHDPDHDRAEAFAAEHGGTAHASEDEVIDAAEAVYVTTWTAEHRRLVEKVVGAGRAVFVEKPLAVDVADATAMVAAIESAGVVNQVGLVLRDSPAFLGLRQLVQRPASGRLMSIVFRDDQYLPVQGLYGSTWRADVTRAGGGTLLEHSIHDLDLLAWLAGPVESVSARTASFHGIDGIEDLAVVTATFASGALSTLTSVWHDVLTRPSLRRVEVFCERAHYVLEGDVDGPLRWTVERPASDDRFGAAGVAAGGALRHLLAAEGVAIRNPDVAFVEAVAAGSPARPRVADALVAHALCDAAYRSAATDGMPAAVELAG